MKYIASTLCILFLLCGNAYAFDKWTPQQKQLEIANQVFLCMSASVIVGNNNIGIKFVF